MEYEDLTIEEILNILGPDVPLSRAGRRSRTVLSGELSTLNDGYQHRLREAVKLKKEHTIHHSILSIPLSTVPAYRSPDWGEFMIAPNEETKRTILNQFRESTSNEGLRHRICGVCARLLSIDEGGFQLAPFTSIPNRDRLRPASIHPTQFMFDNCILEEKGCMNSAVGLFNTKWLARERDHLRIEYGADYPHVGGKFAAPSPATTRICYFSHLCWGRKAAEEMATIDISCSAGCLTRALLWLKKMNPKYYAAIEIDSTRLQSLPEDDIPQEILAIIRQEPTSPLWKEKVPVLQTMLVTVLILLRAIIPFLGCHDTDLTNISAAEMTVGVWQIYEFYQTTATTNIWEKTYPILFPFGTGGFEHSHRRPISLTEHIRWALQYFDRRFQEHHMIAFHLFSIVQKRQVLSSARIQMHRQTFDRDTHLLSSLTVSKLQQAAREEERGQQCSDPAVRLLKKEMHATSGRICGSNIARRNLCSEIWGTTIALNPPSLWITINPDDLHNPIVQILCGEEIDMDEFCKTIGPDRARRSLNVAQNPWAAAKYYHLIMNLIFEQLFGIAVAPNGRTICHEGVLGKVEAYYGVTESQGRGTLHAHCILWLKDAPCTERMHELLQNAAFRERIVVYSDTIARAFHPTLQTLHDLSATPTTADVAYDRQRDPLSPRYNEDVDELLKNVVRSKQMHTCSRETCLKMDRKGEFRCKRRAPWPISTHTIVTASGEWKPKRSLPYMNTWMPTISETLMANNDINILLNGKETMSLSFYVTNYATKNQASNYNTSAVLAKGLAYHFDNDEYIGDLLERQCLLLFRAVNSINHQQEVAAPMIMSYLMGWGDVFRSHRYVHIYWSTFVSHLLREHHYLCSSAVEGEEVSNHDFSQRRINNSINAQETSDEFITFEGIQNGNVVPRSQLQDYIFRGAALENYSIYNFFVDTYEISYHDHGAADEDAGENDVPHSHPRHTRARYLEGHQKRTLAQRVIRSEGHNTLPNFIGQSFPRSDDEDCREFYCACMLMLLSPWRQLSQLKMESSTWKEAFDIFYAETSAINRNILSNIQHFHRCKAAADAINDEEFHPEGETRYTEDDEEQSDSHEMDVDADEDMITAMMTSCHSAREVEYGKMAIRIGESMGIFPDMSMHLTISEIPIRLDSDRREQLLQWREEMTSRVEEVNHERSGGRMTDAFMHGDVYPLEECIIMPEEEEADEELAEASLCAMDVEFLRKDQRRAYDIITSHLQCTLRGEHPQQLLMLVFGEGGTGKSCVIQTSTEEFKHLRVIHMLLKTAYTGIAASVVNGEPLTKWH
ncbi:hypothetical protein A0H81_11694 [Grifola frondosa]|uniref:Helitron helicase-like domain-containing protein n=1 Tax=Grifola frondosa TaxID=5627 RepID=A0A1C7LUP4_GRIFR|nr:hypothetical protein A0H81_11694 [Grifola frondosa]